jgi:hypothetical protein
MLKLQRHSREISAPAGKARVTFSSAPAQHATWKKG